MLHQNEKNKVVLTINASSTTNRMLRIPASREAFEHNLGVLNSFNQPPAVSELMASGDRRHSIDAAIVALSWANRLICDLQIHNVRIALEYEDLPEDIKFNLKQNFEAGIQTLE